MLREFEDGQLLNMIERLETSIRALSEASPDDLFTEQGRRLRADCADVVRLELDCMQLSLTSRQRESLSTLFEVLEEVSAPPASVIAAAREAAATMGLAQSKPA